ncbi:MAG: glycosyltransferase [Dysgonamonadaceae bacterium]|jgi:glycosyltransferase involved in cell wall biosynthesis|nr:glycosyltransferase [Dysgonamonadaceae bacterium]
MKLSIITVNLNNVEGLKKTVDSVIAQTFTDFEYIIIDGASTDGSLDLIKNSQLSTCNFQLVSEPDKGIYDAMNKGIKLAKGEYCLFLNSGDFLYSNNVLKAVFDTDYQEDIITGNYIELYKNRTVLRKGRAYARQQEGKSLTLIDLYVGSISHQATFIRTKLFEQYGLYDTKYRIVSDWVFFLKTIGLNKVSVKYIDITVVNFDMYGLSNSNDSPYGPEREDALKTLLPPAIYEDYKRFAEIEYNFHYMLSYKFTYQIARLMNKLAIAWYLLTEKIRNALIKRGFKIKHRERTF